MTEKCFKKCINKPGTSLDNSEQVGYFLTFKNNLIVVVFFFFLEMYSNVYGSVYGLLELSFKSV